MACASSYYSLLLSVNSYIIAGIQRNFKSFGQSLGITGKHLYDWSDTLGGGRKQSQMAQMERITRTICDIHPFPAYAGLEFVTHLSVFFYIPGNKKGINEDQRYRVSVNLRAIPHTEAKKKAA
jgi:hypothetical protein